MIFKYKDIEIADDFLNMLFSECITENVDFLEDTFLDNIIHKTLIHKFSKILPKLYSITEHLIENSSLNIEVNEHIVKLFSISALSVCVLNEMDFLKEFKFKKNNYEIELKSMLEELKLGGIGNGLVKNLADIYKAIVEMSVNLFGSKKIFEIFSKANFLDTIDAYIIKHSLSINNIASYFAKIFNTIYALYANKLNDKIAQISKKKTVIINEIL